MEGVIDQCRELGGIVEPHVSQSQGGKFAGKTVLFTGTLQTMSRVEAETLAKAEGGKVVKAVSKSLDVLVVGENAGSKLKKVMLLNEKGSKIQILTEADFKLYI